MNQLLKNQPIAQFQNDLGSLLNACSDNKAETTSTGFTEFSLAVPQTHSPFHAHFLKPHVALLIAVLWLGCQAPTLAQGVYLQIPGITDGAGTNPALRDQVKLSTFVYGQKTPVTIGGNGASAGRPTFMSIEIAKPVDASSSKLQQALTSATAFRSPPVINFYDANLRLVYQIKLGTAFISDYSASGDDVCAGGCPGLLENITLQYGQIKVTDSSHAGTPLTFSWNVITNNASTGL